MAMARSDNLRREIARLDDKDAALHKELARHESDAQKHRAEAGKKREAAEKTKSSSQTSSHRRAADAASKRAVDAEKKVADVKRKLAGVAKQHATKTAQLRREEASERQTQTRDDARRRTKEKQHSRQLSAISTPQIRYVVVHPPKPEKLRVLYLTANPGDGVEFLRTEAEVRGVQQEIRGALHRDLIEMNIRSAAGPDDLLQGINDVRPHVVHFSGHGGGSGILFDSGDIVSPTGLDMNYDDLVAFLSATDEPPKLLVLNGCDTLEGADVLLQAVPVVVAMSDTISDLAAGVFAAKFYGAIASAQSVGAALRQGKAALSILTSAAGHLPELLARAKE
jgi:hypothetical protein